MVRMLAIHVLIYSHILLTIATSIMSYPQTGSVTHTADICLPYVAFNIAC